jgi:hypothetical protein
LSSADVTDSHLEGTVKQKRSPIEVFDFFIMSCRQSLQYRFFIKVWRQSSLRQTPIRIEATPRDHSQKRAHSAHCGPENLRLRSGSISYLTYPMALIHQSHRAPGPGSKDASNSYFSGATGYQSYRWVSTSRCMGSPSHHLLRVTSYVNILSGINKTPSLIM